MNPYYNNPRGLAVTIINSSLDVSSQFICKYLNLEEISRGLTSANQEIAENISAKGMAESF